ncbi:MAG: XamI family restriction endonuclease [Kiritimatiellia bacterium]
MGVNRNNIDAWKRDIAESVDYYNRWFLNFAPETFRSERRKAEQRVKKAFSLTDYGRKISAESLLSNIGLLTVVRQMTCPPLARDRLAGLAGVPPSFVKRIEEDGVAYSPDAVKRAKSIAETILTLIDNELLPWLKENRRCGIGRVESKRAALVVADRLCGALSDPIFRNAQESRQLSAIKTYLTANGYRWRKVLDYQTLEPGEFSFHLPIHVHVAEGRDSDVIIPVDVAVLPKTAHRGEMPLIIEAKSAGDFANVNKRRKEEAHKVAQLRQTYGEVKFVLFLCGYFDAGYLGYEAAEGIDWVWEHRISDMEKLGL